MWSLLQDRTMHNVQSPSLKTSNEEFLTKITYLRDYCVESACWAEQTELMWGASTLRSYSTAHVYVNRKTRIKRTKNRMQLRMKKIMRARLWDINLISMYEVVLLFYYCWRFIVLKNRLKLKSTKILHGYQRQANLLLKNAITNATS